MESQLVFLVSQILAINISKAFHRVLYEALFIKLWAIRTITHFKKWIENFLNNG